METKQTCISCYSWHLSFFHFLNTECDLHGNRLKLRFQNQSLRWSGQIWPSGPRQEDHDLKCQFIWNIKNPTGQCIPEQVTFIQFTCRFQNVKTTDNYKWHTNSKQQLKLQHCYSQSIKIGQSSKTKSDDVKTYNWSHSDLSRVACWSLHKHVLWTANLDVFLFHFVFFWATLKSILFSCVWKLGQWATTFWVHWPSGQNLLFEPLLNQHNQMDIRGGSWH